MVPVHRLVDDPRSGQALTAQGGDEGLRAPVAEGRVGFEALAPARATAQACHLGSGAGLVDEDEAVRLLAHAWLTAGLPLPPCLGDGSAFGFARRQAFF
jgi:hypothetical protein